MPGAVIALLGAESTGKTTLAQALQRSLAAPEQRVACVPEALREFCLHHGRTPRRDEQAAIAHTQSQRIAEAAAQHDLVIADTTALMVAVYSQLLFHDASLLPDALASQAQYRATLLMALDVPWAPDPGIRDGAHVREPVDALLRSALSSAGLGFAVISGHDDARLAHALRAVQAALRPASADEAPRAARWRATCAECGDPDCERHLFALAKAERVGRS